MKTRALAAALLLSCAGAFAQPYPERAVKVIVPFTPGSATDILGRLTSEQLAKSLGRPFVVENRPGASGSIAAGAVAKSAPDGHTLIMVPSTYGTASALYDSLPYSEAELTPVGLIGSTPYVFVVHPSIPVASFGELIALLKKNPGKYEFASSSPGTAQHLGGELVKRMAGVDMLHVPYKGSAPAMTDLIGGQINYAVETVASVVGHVKAGRLKVFGVTTAQRTASLPDVPTLAEAADLPGFDAAAWIGYSAPAGTPREIVVRLSEEIQKAMRGPDMRERYVALGLDQASSTPDEMAAYMVREQERYATIIKNAGIKIQQ